MCVTDSSETQYIVLIWKRQTSVPNTDSSGTTSGFNGFKLDYSNADRWSWQQEPPWDRAGSLTSLQNKKKANALSH